ncbi:hypothetical protein BU26DRAFT_419698 [Trematosphaeria pertusa]|uniref:Uncharacterized protein n=1 Tax=Trematosphaeria pertusa TaxID=390896 RepID=A0A6A6IRU6_9PLEO|nr:uncharacterized protein BU26DRAFT_419698 [Trematosphaeria pertusa]KAF2252867.1 hypothetical protein BU26DRAFT_419698 [Trematosphaeria pertusa]
MATPWPQRSIWPTEIRESTTYLSTFLHDILHPIKHTSMPPQGWPEEFESPDIISDIIHGVLTFVLKMHHIPNLSAICDALSIIKTKVKTTAENTAQVLPSQGLCGACHRAERQRAHSKREDCLV